MAWLVHQSVADLLYAGGFSPPLICPRGTPMDNAHVLASCMFDAVERCLSENRFDATLRTTLRACGVLLHQWLFLSGHRFRRMCASCQLIWAANQSAQAVMWLLASPDNREARLARQCLRADHWTLFGSAHSSAPSTSRPQ
eukprot:3050798-Alexandrium_andersonii.AAC.1